MDKKYVQKFWDQLCGVQVEKPQTSVFKITRSNWSIFYYFFFFLRKPDDVFKAYRLRGDRIQTFTLPTSQTRVSVFKIIY